MKEYIMKKILIPIATAALCSSIHAAEITSGEQFSLDSATLTGEDTQWRSETGNNKKFDLVDSSLNSRSATLINGALNFDGTDDLAWSSRLDGDSATFEFMLSFNEVNKSQTIFETGGGVKGMALGLDSSNRLVFALGGDSSGGAKEAVSAAIKDFNNPIHIVAVADSVNLTTTLYINGQSSSTGVYAAWNGGNDSAIGYAKGGSSVGSGQLGAGAGNILGYLDADMSLFRYYTNALDATEVQANYLATTGSAVPEPSAGLLAILAGVVFLLCRRK